MENQIVNSQFKLLETVFNNSNISVDLGLLTVLFLCLTIMTVIIVGYLRDKNKIYNTDDLSKVKDDTNYNFRCIRALEQRVETLENKDINVSELYKSIKELKKMIKDKL